MHRISCNEPLGSHIRTNPSSELAANHEPFGLNWTALTGELTPAKIR